MKKIIVILLLSINATAQTTNPAPYCDVPINMSPTTCKGGITNVHIGTLNNTTTLTGKYTYYDNLTAPILYRGMAYSMSITFDTVATSCRPASSKYMVVMAYENSGVGLGTSFLVANDSVYNGDATTVITPVTKTFTVNVPLSAPIGYIRMRVIRYGLPSSTYLNPKCIGTGGDAGNYYLVGETEDYNVRILDPISMGVNSGYTPTVSVYPNPCTDKLNISVFGNISISNELGQIVYQNKNYEKELIDVSNFANGIYFVNINGNVTRISKF